MSEPTGDFERRIQELLDKQAIRDLVVRYFRGLDTCDVEMVRSVYHPDAVDVRGPRTLSGGDLAKPLVDASKKNMAQTRHHLTTHVIEIDGDTAVSEAYCVGVHVTLGDPPKRLQTSGRYNDRLERRDGEWRIVRRDVFMDMFRSMPIEDGYQAS